MYSVVCKAFSNMKILQPAPKRCAQRLCVCRSSLHPSADLCPRGWLLCASLLASCWVQRLEQTMHEGRFIPWLRPIARFFLNSRSWNCSPALIALAHLVGKTWEPCGLPAPILTFANSSSIYPIDCVSRFLLVPTIIRKWRDHCMCVPPH